ncbi:MAG: segregation/condensation protein A, partial [Alphaproteobacteria bacterium]
MENSSHNAETNPDFEDDGGAPEARDALILRLEGYEGPIDLLLDLARDQRVDLSQISILALVDQYLQFMRLVKRKRLDLAAEYLVMA